MKRLNLRFLSNLSRAHLVSAAFAVIVIGALFVSLKLYSPPEKAAKFNTIIEIDSVEASAGDTLSISFRVDVHPKDKQFTIIALPDTQYYSKFYPEIYIAQTQWIVDNIETLNIGFVAHLGDVVHDWDDIELEWQRASDAMAILDGEVPYGILAGNHDMQIDGVAEFYNEYFPEKRYSKYPWWGGSFRGNKNNYQLLTLGRDDYIFINLEFCPHNDTLNWAKDLLSEHSDRIAVVSTHAYLIQSGELDNSTCALHSEGHVSSNNGERMWSYVIRQHPNVALVLNGHFPGVARRTTEYEGRTIHQILADFQDYENGGNGYLRIMTFYPNEDLIKVRTYSPTLDHYDTTSENEFELRMDMTPIGTPTGQVSIQTEAGQCTASVGAGFCEITGAAEGTIHITANYSGDEVFSEATVEMDFTP